MRLIDADELLELMKEQKEREIGAYAKGINAGLNIVKSIINDETQTPTAYDVDKVIEEFKGASWLTTNDDGETNKLSIQVVSFDDAIEIVKAGGINGN